MIRFIFCIFVLALPLWLSHAALGAEPTSFPAVSQAPPATLEVLRQWRANLKTDGLEKAMEAIAASEAAFPKIHTYAYYERRAAEATPAAMESLGLAEGMAAAMPLYGDRLRQRPIGELKGAASTAALAAEKVLAGGGYGNLVLAIAIVGTVRPVLLGRMMVFGTLPYFGPSSPLRPGFAPPPPLLAQSFLPVLSVLRG